MKRSPDVPREYPPMPLVGVGAIISHKGRILLIRRGRPPSAGEWSIPGGLVEVGEALAHAVKREALEETGLEVEPQLLVELLERIFPDEAGRIRYHYILADYLCRVTGGVPAAGTDALDAVWVHPSEIHWYGPAPVTLRVIAKAVELCASLDTPPCDDPAHQ